MTDNVGDLYEVRGDTLRKFDMDSIISITKCNGNFYILKAPNDTTLIIEESNGTALSIKNKTGFESNYFALWTNEKCDVILESGMAAFKIQKNSLIDLESIYGFTKIERFNGSDKFGYFDNFIFLAQYGGEVFQTYLDGDSNKYPLPKNISIKDHTLHNDELWLVTSFYEIVEKQKILKVKDGKVQEVVIKGMPDQMDITLIYSNDNDFYFLSEKLGFFKFKGNKFEQLISIDLEKSNVSPESFIVHGDTIFYPHLRMGLSDL